MTDRRQAIRGVTIEGLAIEAADFIAARPDLPWPSAWKAWCAVAGLDLDREREVKVEVLRRRCFGRAGE